MTECCVKKATHLSARKVTSYIETAGNNVKLSFKGQFIQLNFSGVFFFFWGGGVVSAGNVYMRLQFSLKSMKLSFRVSHHCRFVFLRLSVRVQRQGSDKFTDLYVTLNLPLSPPPPPLEAPAADPTGN